MELSSMFITSISPSVIYPRVWSGSHKKVGLNTCADKVYHRQATFKFWGLTSGCLTAHAFETLCARQSGGRALILGTESHLAYPGLCFTISRM